MAAVGADAAVDDDGIEGVKLSLLGFAFSTWNIQGQFVLNVGQDFTLCASFAVVFEPKKSDKLYSRDISVFPRPIPTQQLNLLYHICEILNQLKL